MKRCTFCLFILFLSVTSKCFCSIDTIRLSMQSGGYNREYLLYLPKTYSETNPANLMVCLHGFNSSMDVFFNEYGIMSVADSLNTIVLAPQALPEQDPKVIANAALLASITGEKIPLDAAWGCGLRVVAKTWIITLLNEELNKPVDDVAFIRSMIEKTLSEYHINENNQFIFGTSMGGYMSYQYAMYEGDNLSGLVSICGSMGTSIQNKEAKVSVPICDFHSVDDEVVPYTGSFEQSNITVTLCLGKEEVINEWVEKNSAMKIPNIEPVNYYPSTNNKTVEKYTYIHPVNEVIHYKIHNAEHRYYFKKENDCMDYNEEVIKFVTAHTKTDNTGIEELVMPKMNVWPNPATDFVQLSLPEGYATVFDLTGKQVLSTPFQFNRLDISSLNSGVYVIKVVSGDQVFVTKITIR